ncbi:DUF3667 domain-containing protein [Hymenobacter negativus]|uniref:DUF3667 domain-containing protein n=1 Tax=Hymenobacter negativus TaxID=2795026 RepID=A0ABS0QDX2_9BACT|nr:DUF3667 domain-containing protein [Hymenobacter negativus]MBH8560538.1 DUF3667 domain-containing protein [Hymenobacter negativus]
MSDASSAHAAACLNCGHVLPPPGCFCPQCGQAPAHRLSTAHVLHEVLHVFTHADKGIFAFIPQVLFRPGQLVADYLAGRRKRHFNPFQFLLLLVGFVTLLGVKLHYYEGVGASVAAAMQRLKPLTPAQLLRVEQYFHTIGAFFNVYWLALLPVQALLTWAAYRRRAGLNYAVAVLVQVVVGCAFQLLLLLALPTVRLLGVHQPGLSTALLQGFLTALYLLLIGRRGLGLPVSEALGRALLVGLLAGLLNFGANYAAFNLYVFHG